MNPLKLSKAKQILEGVKTAEQAVELTGTARKEYLAALDVLHGPAEKRAKDMGFGEKTYYHGTANVDIHDFQPAKVNSVVEDGKPGAYFIPDSEVAGNYAEGKADNVRHKEWTKKIKELESSGEYLPHEVDSIAQKELDKNTSGEVLYPVKIRDDLSTKLSDWGVPSRAVKVQNPGVRSEYAAFDPRFADSPKLLAGAAAIPAMGNQFSNPADIVKAGYEKFEQARQSVVNKIVDLTDMTKDNPHVPQYAKDTYNKAADALVSNATDPLNFIGGAGAADAVIGAGSAAYEMYNSNKPTSTIADNKPMTNPTQTVNWRK